MTQDLRLALLRTAGHPEAATALALRLDETQITVEADGDHALLALSVANLVARLWPNTRLVGPTTAIPRLPFGTGSFPSVGATLVRTVRLSVPARPKRVVRVALGQVDGPADVYATSDEWSIRIGSGPVAPLSGVRGPGTTAAAALIAAALFQISIPESPGSRLAGQREWNLVDYAARVSPSAPTLSPVDATLFGFGSVGSSMLLALLVAAASGDLAVVDDDVLQSRNRLRYPLWIGTWRGSKAHWAERMARGSGVRVRAHAMTAGTFADGVTSAPRLAISAVDTTQGRAEVADVLARVTLNAGVDGLRLHVSRHGFADGLACVYCAYVDVSPPSSEVDVFVGLTGLQPGRVAQLLGGARLSRDDIEALVRAGRLDEAEAADLEGGRLADVARARLYAAAALPAAVGVAVTAPFVSAMAGAVLAAEALKGAGSGNELNRRVDVDMSGWPTGFTSRRAADPTHRCLCWSPIRRRAYAGEWDSGPL